MIEKDFVINMLFDKPNLKWIANRKFNKSKDLSQEPTKEFDLPLVNAKNGNNGIMYFGRSSDFSYVNGGIDIVNDGAVSTGNVYPQPHKIGVLYNAYIITLKKEEYNTDRKILEYLACVIEKNIKHRFSYSDKAGWDKVKQITIKLPIKIDETNNPIIDNSHFYHDEGFVPDFNYMQERIEELEQERIEELEQYLIATGLNDYELTAEDIETLSLFNFKRYEELDSEDVVKVFKKMKEFTISSIFDVITPSKRFNANTVIITENVGHPYVVRSSSNNGIRGFIDEDEKYLNNKNTFSFGQDTATIFWQPQAYFTGDKIKVLKPKFKCNDEIANFIINRIEMAFSNFSWGSQSFKTSVIENMYISLPIQTDANNNPIIDVKCMFHKDGYIPDWDFMKKYIKAIEKIVIADVVKFKDTVIDKTREAVSG